MLKLQWRFPPPRPRLQPEDLRGYVAVLGGIKEISGDLGIGLGLAEVEFLAVVLPEGLGIDSQNSSNVGLWNAVSRHGLDLATLRWIRLVGAAAHQVTLSTW